MLSIGKGDQSLLYFILKFQKQPCGLSPCKSIINCQIIRQFGTVSNARRSSQSNNINVRIITMWKVNVRIIALTNQIRSHIVFTMVLSQINKTHAWMQEGPFHERKITKDYAGPLPVHYIYTKLLIKEADTLATLVCCPRSTSTETFQSGEHLRLSISLMTSGT